MQLDKCCYCVGLRTGIIIIAIIYVISCPVLGYVFGKLFKSGFLQILDYILYAMLAIMFLMIAYVEIARVKNKSYSDKKGYMYVVGAALFYHLWDGLWAIINKGKYAYTVPLTVVLATYDLYALLVTYSYYKKSEPPAPQ